MRHAIYFTPPADHALTNAGSAWLGRDSFRDDPVSQPDIDAVAVDEFDDATQFPRHYGFHATVVAPFRLRTDIEEVELIAALRDFCERCTPVELTGMAAMPLGKFLALQAPKAKARLEKLSHDAVEWFERFQAPLSEADIARRQPEKLSPRQRDLLFRWGYPYVREQYRFHMTLAGPLNAEQMVRFQAAAGSWFGEALADSVWLDGLALFVQPRDHADFVIREHFPFAQTPRGN